MTTNMGSTAMVSKCCASDASGMKCALADRHDGDHRTARGAQWPRRIYVSLNAVPADKLHMFSPPTSPLGKLRAVRNVTKGASNQITQRISALESA